MRFRKSVFKDLDKTILSVTSIILIIGLFAIYSATQARALAFKDSFILRQVNWMAIGIVLMALFIKISYQRFIDIAYILYAFNIGLLIFVLTLGTVRLGAQRWFALGNFAFQPSEFIKLSLILSLASYIGSRKEAMSRLSSIVVPILLLTVPVALVIIQPDLGTAFLLVPIFFFMLLTGGANLKHLIGLMAMGLASLPLFWHMLREYQRQRLLVFMNPNIDPLGAGYTIIQSKIAIGSGGLFGKGWLAGTQSQLNFLPERHTDFIFSVIGEEWGFLGAMLLVLLYLFIIKRSFNIAALTSDIYGRLIAVGIATMLSLQVLVNIGMTIGIMPVVGIPLPLVSYGGSSLVTTLCAIALLINVGARRSTF